jgi:hypothetical protein
MHLITVRSTQLKTRRKAPSLSHQPMDVKRECKCTQKRELKSPLKRVRKVLFVTVLLWHNERTWPEDRATLESDLHPEGTRDQVLGGWGREAQLLGSGCTPSQAVRRPIH